MRRALLGLAIGACLWRCDSAPPPPPEPERDTGEVRPLGKVDLEVPRPRAARRMDVAQLDASFKSLMGGMSWTTAGGDEEGDMFELFAPQLGVPDYVRTTHEDRSTSILFAKFLEDAAVSVCNRRVTADEAAPAGGRIIMAPSDDGFAVKIVDLVLAFHGNARPSVAEGVIWDKLFFDAKSHALATGASAAAARHAAWVAVCVALIEHPDFTTY